MTKANYHTHTCICDGANTPREMVESALDKGFTHIGFSGHSYTPFDEEVSMSPEGTREYKKELSELKKEYSDRICIYTGIELDFYSKISLNDFDYIIGSVHYCYKDGQYLAVDDTRQLFEEAVNEHYDGDVYAFVEAYYETMAEMVQSLKPDIIGHFDLITKYNENEDLFSTSHPRYIKAVDDALLAINPKNKVFEINTGAMSRRCRSSPYPSLDIIKKIAAAEGKFILSSDAHAADNLDYGFTQVREWLAANGISKSCLIDTLNIV